MQNSRIAMTLEQREQNVQVYMDAVRDRATNYILQQCNKKTDTKAADSQHNSVDLSFYKQLIVTRRVIVDSLEDQRVENIIARERLANAPFRERLFPVCITETMFTPEQQETEVIFDGKQYYCNNASCTLVSTSEGRHIRVIPISQEEFSQMQQAAQHSVPLKQAQLVYYTVEGRRKPFIKTPEHLYWCNMNFSIGQQTQIEARNIENQKMTLVAINTAPNDFQRMIDVCQQFDAARRTRITEEGKKTIQRNTDLAMKEELRTEAAVLRKQQCEREIAAYYMQLRQQPKRDTKAEDIKAQHSKDKIEQEKNIKRAETALQMQIRQKRHKQIEQREADLQQQGKQLRDRLVEEANRSQQQRLNSMARRVQLLRWREAQQQQKKEQYAEQLQNDADLLATRDNNIREHARIGTKELLAKYKKG